VVEVVAWFVAETGCFVLVAWSVAPRLSEASEDAPANRDTVDVVGAWKFDVEAALTGLTPAGGTGLEPVEVLDAPAATPELCVPDEPHPATTRAATANSAVIDFDLIDGASFVVVVGCRCRPA
jgi:hypothetical protein